MTEAAPNAPILVTGASGFLGERIVAKLAGARRRVAGTYLDHPIAIPGADVAPCDLGDARAVDRLMRDLRPAVVIHTAAWTDANACERDPNGARVGIVDATANIAGALTRHAPHARLVMVSTDLVFDGEGAPYREGAPCKPIMTYGSLKVEAERAALEHPGACVVRSALMYGPRGTHRGSFLDWMVAALAQGKALDLFVDEFRTPVFVDDLADGLLALAASNATGVFHAGGPERLSRVEMGRALCAECGFDAGLIRERRLADVTLTAARPRDVSLDSARFWNATGITPADFAEGLRRTFAAQHALPRTNDR